jgi:alginate O-acetyltransferase complex protein AlgI
MMSYLALPSIWLGAYLLGRFRTFGTGVAQNQILLALSLAMLVGVLGAKTALAYIAIAGAFLFSSVLLQKTTSASIRKIILIGSIGLAIVLLIIGLRYPKQLQVVLPLLPSLSYLCFRAISLLVDIYRGSSPDWTASSLQLVFFPVIPMGPITRVDNFQSTEDVDYEDVLKRLLMGFSMLGLAALVAPGIVAPNAESLAEVSKVRFLSGLVCLSFNIYWEFGGYSHLIIGLSMLCGIRVPENFRLPYLAEDITDFWRRWHISLSFWIRDYLYIGLGGNRRGFYFKLLNLMICMTICGLWHGLTWGFLIWGIFHGVLLSVHAIMRHFKWRAFSFMPRLAERCFAVGFTFIWATLGWLFFSYKAGDAFNALVWLFQ